MSEEKKKSKETAGKKTGKKLDRRDFLQGLATVPALGVWIRPEKGYGL